MAAIRLGHIFVIILVASQVHDAIGSSVLSDTILPVQYDLTLSVNTDTLTYSVKESIQLNVKQVSPNISFHAAYTFKVNVERVQLLCKSVLLGTKGLVIHNGIATITFKQDVPVGSCTLDLDESEWIPLTDADGIFVSPNSRNIVTRFQSARASSVFPCFDEPRFKAMFVLTIKHSKQYTPLSNTKAQITMCESEPCVTTFPMSLSMAPSSFGFSLTLDSAQSRSANQIDYQVFGSNANLNGAYKWALDVASSVTYQAQQWLGISNMLPKIDIQSVQNLNRTNDNSWGLFKIRAPLLDFNASEPLQTSVEAIQEGWQAISAGVLSNWLEHEVTPNGSGAAIVYNGLSIYLQYVLMDKMKPDWKFLNQFVVRETQRSLANATLDPTFGQGKSSAASASIVRMMASVVGPKAFQSAVQQYLTTSSMGIVQPVHLFNALQVQVDVQQIALPTTVQQIFRPWFSTRDEILSLNVSRHYDNNSTVTVAKLNPTASADGVKLTPISFASAQKALPDELAWLNSTESTFKIAANATEWLLVNNQATGGYYRVMYDQKNWHLLIDELNGANNSQSIHAVNRAHLIDDAFHFAQTGQLPYDDLFELLTYLKSDHDLVPWATAQRSLEFFERMLRDTEVHPHFEVFVQQITADLYPELSVTIQDEQDHVKRLRRLSVTKLACESGESRCIAEIDKMAEDVLNKVKNVVPELQQTVFCAACRHILTPNSNLDKALRRHIQEILQDKNRTDDDAMTRAAYGFGCTQNDEIINKALATSVMDYPPITNVQIRASDRELLFKAVSVGSYSGTKAALISLRQQYDTLKRHFVSMPSVLDAIAPYITSVELNSLLTEFVNTHSKKFDAEMNAAVAKAKTRAEINLDWAARNVGGISKWLKANITLKSAATSITMNLALVAAAALFTILGRQ